MTEQSWTVWDRQ